MDHVTDALSAFLDGELPQAERLRVESHLDQCSACRGRQEELKSISALVGGLKDGPLPAGFLRRLKTRAAAPAPAPRVFLTPARTLALALPSLALALIALRLGAPPHQEEVSMTLSLPQRAADVPPPAAVSLKKDKVGQPFGETAAPSQVRYTNEMLHAAQEREKAAMGIVKMLPPQPQKSAAEMQWRRAQSRGALRLTGMAPPSVLTTNQPALLSERAAGGVILAPSMQPPAFLETAAVDEGVAARSQEEINELWSRLELRAVPPAVDFSREMLVLVLAGQGRAPMEIADVLASGGRLKIKYRQAPGGSLYPYRVVPLSNLPLAFEKLP